MADIGRPGAGKHGPEITEHARKAARGRYRFLHGYAGGLHAAGQVLRAVYKEADERSQQRRPEEMIGAGNQIEAPAAGGQDDQINNVHLGAAALEPAVSQIPGYDSARHAQKRHPFHGRHSRFLAKSAFLGEEHGAPVQRGKTHIINENIRNGQRPQERVFEYVFFLSAAELPF